MRKSSVRRLANYTAAIDPEHLKIVLTNKRQSMIAQESEIFAEQERIEDLVIGVLASEGAVVTIEYPNYHAFAREVAAKQAHFPGGAGLNSEVAVCLAKWKTRGLVEAVLIRIRNEVFSIPAPAAPGE
jgi:hypothetical protein